MNHLYSYFYSVLCEVVFEVGNRDFSEVEDGSSQCCISACFDCDLAFDGGCRRLYVTLGQFSIIRLERDVQLLVPTFDYSIPTKECCDNLGCAEDPCEMFSRIAFPVQQFYPRGCDGSSSQDASCSAGCSTECGYKTCPTT